MLQNCRVTGSPGTFSAHIDAGAFREPAFPAWPTVRPVSECEWRPFDLVQKRSGPHNLNRLGYDEDKCRNVLVRFCAHVPRNFQYKDGIPQIFLILRDHLGDENLDLAGGVLYELIEVDCEHTDDPGAAFQRWRHDHMYRYADLELPHIPHMTTITSSIIPTEKLSRWRSDHAERYRFVLSDSSPITKRDHIDPSCIRSKKAWLIDHTLFVSTRSEGTRPIRKPNPKEFHEMQWDPDYGASGKLIEEREFPIMTSMDQPSEASPPEPTDFFLCVNAGTRPRRLRRSLSNIKLLEKVIRKLSGQKEPEIGQRRRSWVPNSLIFDSSTLPKDEQANCGIISVPWPDGCQIPNAIFARKFLIVGTSETLPSHLPISQMPTAESKATETIVEAATAGLLNKASPWLFRGPFTPQLGFDGGLDYQWNSRNSGMTIKRFDLEASLLDNPNFKLDHSRGLKAPAYYSHVKSQQLLSRRRGQVFDSDRASESVTEASVSSIRGKIVQHHLPSARPTGKSTDIPRDYVLQRDESLHRYSPLFNNIEFTIQTESNNVCTPVRNRQTTVIEKPGPCETVDPSTIVYDVTSNRVGHVVGTHSSVNKQLASSMELKPNNKEGRNDHNGGQENLQELISLNMQQRVNRLRINAPNSRQVPRRATGEVLRPLRYNASGGWKRTGRNNVQET